MTRIRILIPILVALSWTTGLPAAAQSGGTPVLTCHVHSERPPRFDATIRCHARRKDTTLRNLYDRGWRLIQVVSTRSGGQTTHTLYLDRTGG